VGDGAVVMSRQSHHRGGVQGPVNGERVGCVGGGVGLHACGVTCGDRFDESGQVDGGYQRFVTPADGVEDKAVDEVGDGLSHGASSYLGGEGREVVGGLGQAALRRIRAISSGRSNAEKWPVRDTVMRWTS